MKYYMPVKVYDEPECVKNHAKEITSLGSHALIVTGRKSAFSNGSFDDITAVLTEGGIEFEVFSEVEENPSVETVFLAKERFCSEKIDFVIGLGGGSPMDAAKAIALILLHDDYRPEDLYDTQKESTHLPLVCIPTTCGTGSEVTGVSVLTRHDKKTKISMVHKVFPDIALIDGKYLSYAPHSLIVSSSVDALSHLIESRLSQKADDYVTMLTDAGFKMWASVRDCLAKGVSPDENERFLLMRSAAIAGMSIAQSGTSIPHALSYILTYDLGIPHGQAVAYYLTGFLAEAPINAKNKILHLSGFSDMTDFDTFISGLFNISDLPKEVLERSYDVVRNNSAKMNSASFEVDDTSLRRIVFADRHFSQ